MQSDIPAFLALGIGALLIWAAIQGKNPYLLLRETLAGKPSNPRGSGADANTGTKPGPGTVSA